MWWLIVHAIICMHASFTPARRHICSMHAVTCVHGYIIIVDSTNVSTRTINMNGLQHEVPDIKAINKDIWITTFRVRMKKRRFWA